MKREKSPTRFVIYARVSTDYQARYGVSLAVQEERIRAYVSFVGGEVVDLVVDRGFSGRDADRPGKLSRSTLDLLKTIQSLNEAKRGFVSVREQLDSSTPHGRFTLTILGAMAEMESELISERTRAALHRLRLQGRAFGRAPYGYRKENGRLVEDPERMEVVRRIVGLRDAGISSGRIADALNREGVPTLTGLKWRHSSVISVERTDRRMRRLALDS
jgi:site-specific DNA recombinase